MTLADNVNGLHLDGVKGDMSGSAEEGKVGVHVIKLGSFSFYFKLYQIVFE